jgi:hypothetical protein
VAAASGLDVERLDLAPLAALSALARERRGTAVSVDVILGDQALSLAAWQGGVLHLFRTRLRDSGPREPSWLGREVDRTAVQAGNGSAPADPRGRPRCCGAPACLEGRGPGGRARWRAEGALPVEATDLAWLGAALA